MSVLITATHHNSALPSVAAVETENKYRHGLISTSSLLLCAGGLVTFAPSACEERGLEQITLDAALLIDLLLVGLLPIQSTGVAQVFHHLVASLGFFGRRQLIRGHLYQLVGGHLPEQDLLSEVRILLEVEGEAPCLVHVGRLLSSADGLDGTLHLSRAG